MYTLFRDNLRTSTYKFITITIIKVLYRDNEHIQHIFGAIIYYMY